MSIEYTNLSHSKDLKKFTQIGIFGLKIRHLATLLECGKEKVCSVQKGLTPQFIFLPFQFDHKV
jgi:hypothetical protein